jgi:hypothetical protein
MSGDLNNKILGELQEEIKSKLLKDKASSLRPSKKSKPTLPTQFNVETLPLSIQQSPLFVFAKLVAGQFGEDLNKMFIIPRVQEVTDTIRLTDLGTNFMSAITDSVDFMNRVFRVFKKPHMSPNWLEEIVEDLDHPLYMRFVKLVATKQRVSTAQRPRGPDSVKAVEKFEQKANIEEKMFTFAVRMFLGM